MHDRQGLQPKDPQDLRRRAQKAAEPLVGVLFCPSGDEVHVAAVVSPVLHDRLRAGDLVKSLAGVLGGGGGGRPDFAQGKGKNAGQLPAARAAAETALRAAGLRQ